MTTTMAELTEYTFDETIRSSDLPVVVEFWAEWCPPCKVMAPTLEAIAVDQVPDVQVFKVNVDEQPKLAARYEVLSIPTLLVFCEGALTGRMVGARGRSRLMQEIEESIR
jgi:thioredoxin 1